MTLCVLIASAWLAVALPVGLLLGASMRSTGDGESAVGARIVVPDVIPAEVLASVAAQPRSLLTHRTAGTGPRRRSEMPQRHPRDACDERAPARPTSSRPVVGGG